MPLLPAIELETRPSPDAAVIWLHGLGADGHDFAPIVPQLRLPAEAAIRFIFPPAPMMPVTVNGGYVMPAWYDILEMEIDSRVDVQGIMTSAVQIRAFIDRELERGIDNRRVVVAGFSQGGAVAYQVVLSCDKPLGGLLAMSTYLATADSLDYKAVNRQMPILIQHGEDDPVVPERLGREAAARLKREGYRVSYRSYPMEHAVCPAQIVDIGGWLRDVLEKST